jgi:hypothetical protein
MNAAELMTAFAERTGQRRYLWTDAFAVCNFLGLGETAQALALIDRVHHVLGQHRADDGRRGWISGLADADGEAHPTAGGLRIGKPLPERDAGARLDEALEWDRDGQYFHYLTKWMHALDRAARATGDARLGTWARELADVAHRRFVHETHGARRMYWKMSVDLTRPQVASMGQHDPLDGYVTCLQLESAPGGGPDLSVAKTEYRAMIDPRSLATGDPLGIGGLLLDASRLAQLDRDRPLREALVAGVRAGLEHFIHQGELNRPADRRLAFRELGLAIGLAASTGDRALAPFAPIGDAIVAFWSDDTHRATRTYREHEDINDVMLATSLAPDGFMGSADDRAAILVRRG